jgi:hypothetical protein
MTSRDVFALARSLVPSSVDLKTASIQGVNSCCQPNTAEALRCRFSVYVKASRNAWICKVSSQLYSLATTHVRHSPGKVTHLTPNLNCASLSFGLTKSHDLTFSLLVVFQCPDYGLFYHPSIV